jgi:TetR/AcrR family transcriptional regulator, regulator of cefoperazone and chloramphenicol sensitivity
LKYSIDRVTLRRSLTHWHRRMNQNLDRVDAQAALLDAAIDLFGVYGFAAVSTRMLSERAGTNLAAITYHFGSKDGLYRATVAHVIGQLAPRLEMARAAFEQGRALAGTQRDLQARLVADLIRGIMETFLRNPDVSRLAPLVLREFFNPGPHFDEFYGMLPKRIHELVAEVVGMADGIDPRSETAIVRAHALVGQMMVFNIGRQILFRRTGWSGYTEPRLELLIAEVQRSALRSLDLPEVNRGEG